MSLQSQADLSMGGITVGGYVRINSTVNLRSKIGSYYNILSETSLSQDPVQGTPYVDFSGLGLIMSVCLPVTFHTKLRGVSCVDVSLSEMASDIISLHHSNNAYGFISDYKSRTIVHPLMPDALNYKNIVYLDITDLERNPDVTEIISSMKNGTSGSKTIQTQFIRSRGNTTNDGVETFNIQAQYVWKSIGRLRLAIITTPDDVNIDLTSPEGVLASDSFTYHRIDLVNHVNKCQYFKRISTKDHSVVKLTQAAFKSQQLYRTLAENEENIERFKVYLNDHSREYPHDSLTMLAKKTIAVSERLDGIWKGLVDHDDYVIWRYYGDYYGHIRIFPGITLPQAYDHTQRPFFWKTVYSQQDIITITPPYLDAFGAGIVVSVCSPIFLPVSSQVSSNKVIGVLGLDMKISFLEITVKNIFPACSSSHNRCFIMDNSGYLVYHTDIVYNEEDDKNKYNGYHITEKEPDVSTFLINNSYMTQKDCIDYGYKKNLVTWRVNIDIAIERFDRMPYFDLIPISGTNLYIGIKKATQFSSVCPCEDRASTYYGLAFFYCSRRSGLCSCPCVRKTQYEYCRNQFQLGRDVSPTCYPQPPRIGWQSPTQNESSLVDKLPRCFNDRCANDTLIESSCVLRKNCRWCSGVNVCRNVYDRCPNPVQNVSTDMSAKTFIIVGACVGISVVIIAVVAGTLGFLWHHGRLTICGEKKPMPGVYKTDTSIYADPSIREQEQDQQRQLPSIPQKQQKQLHQQQPPQQHQEGHYDELQSVYCVIND